MKDQSELLEFRVLELEEGQDKVSSGSFSYRGVRTRLVQGPGVRGGSGQG